MSNIEEEALMLRLMAEHPELVPPALNVEGGVLKMLAPAEDAQLLILQQLPELNPQ